MEDLVIILPGIMGSVLSRDGKEVWGIGGGVLNNLLHLGDPLRALQLPEGIGDNAPDDGVAATALMPSAQIIPGFWNLVYGYSELVDYLEKRLGLKRSKGGVPGNLLLFPYDWRLSNRLNGRRLADSALPALARWRAAGHPDAKLVLVCHSMGGLVARWFLEVLGGREVTRRLVTIGTPYRGSIAALDNLANGFAPGLGPIRIKLDSVLRSFPSVHQLLPTYRCIETADGLKGLDGVDIPNVKRSAIDDALKFHATIAAAVDPGSAVRIHAFKGIMQPTWQTAKLLAAGVEPVLTYDGEDLRGDGTVPRASAHPPEWEDEDRCVYFGQKHGALQAEGNGMLQLRGILTEKMIKFMGEITRVGLDMPDLVTAGGELPVAATVESGERDIPLVAELSDEEGNSLDSRLMKASAEGVYRTAFRNLAPGGRRVRISSEAAARSVEPVTGLTLVMG